VRIECIQEYRSSAPIRPRLKVTSPTLYVPLILIVWFTFEFPPRYSITVLSMFIPLTSWKAPRMVLASPVVKSTRKLKLLYGFSRSLAIA